MRSVVFVTWIILVTFGFSARIWSKTPIFKTQFIRETEVLLSQFESNALAYTRSVEQLLKIKHAFTQNKTVLAKCKIQVELEYFPEACFEFLISAQEMLTAEQTAQFHKLSNSVCIRASQIRPETIPQQLGQVSSACRAVAIPARERYRYKVGEEFE